MKKWFANKTPVSPEEKQRHKQLQKMLKQHEKSEKNVTKVLLLGTGESGKSTIFKQARQIFSKGFKPDELEQFRPKVMKNIILQVQAVLDFRQRKNIEFSSEECQKLEDRIMSIAPKKVPGFIDSGLSKSLQALWADDSVQECWRRRGEFQVFDSLDYFLSEEVLQRISDEGEKYVPSATDVVQCRDVTTGVISMRFSMEGLPFEMVDVGGQRSERKKWISCFDSVTTVIFVVALSEYDQTLYEDESVPRMAEALKVWRDIANRDDFSHVGFVLFLNKVDLFHKKLKEIPFRVADGPQARNQDYTGPEPMDCAPGSEEETKAFEACTKHISDQFQRAVENKERAGMMKCLETVATDKSIMDSIFKSCREQLLRLSFDSAGFIRFGEV